ncbi:MAG: hypothetical protein M5U28_40455 [Sandaracinaceae bacterium]|nr:hypothetical protein [Sandaracinaceae bacterium]
MEVTITRSGCRGLGCAGEEKMRTRRLSSQERASGTSTGKGARGVAAPISSGPMRRPSTTMRSSRSRNERRLEPSPSERSLTVTRSTRRSVSPSPSQASAYSEKEWITRGVPSASRPR